MAHGLASGPRIESRSPKEAAVGRRDTHSLDVDVGVGVSLCCS